MSAKCVFTSLFFAAQLGGTSSILAEGKAEQPSIASIEKDVGEIFARARLEPKQGSNVQGFVVFAKTDVGAEIVARVEGASPGLKGMHVHEKGDCSAEDASSAGGHYNPGKKPHGHVGFHGVHAGDFGNIPIDESGVGMLNIVVTDKMNLGLKDWNNFIGKAVVLHDGTDDLSSQPSGDSGNRIACGVIQKTP
ncbi:MAG: superoxide dismutase family protein [Oligoflexus sp.]